MAVCDYTTNFSRVCVYAVLMTRSPLTIKKAIMQVEITSRGPNILIHALELADRNTTDRIPAMAENVELLLRSLMDSRDRSLREAKGTDPASTTPSE